MSQPLPRLTCDMLGGVCHGASHLDITGFYHVTAMGKWKQVVEEQLSVLKEACLLNHRWALRVGLLDDAAAPEVARLVDSYVACCKNVQVAPFSSVLIFLRCRQALLRPESPSDGVAHSSVFRSGTESGTGTGESLPRRPSAWSAPPRAR